jgi:hypothetical protein
VFHSNILTGDASNGHHGCEVKPMKKGLLLLLAVVALAGLPAVAGAVDEFDDNYDARSDRRYAPPPPPPPPQRAPLRQDARPVRHGARGEGYFFAHLGGYEPNSEIDGLKGYDSGGHFDVGIGSRLNAVFAVDGSFGAFAAERGNDEVSVVPLTVGARLIIPGPFIEPYVGGGLGLYATRLKEAPAAGYSGIDDNRTDLGGYFSIGTDLWLNPRMALNLEGKHHFVNPTFTTNAGNSVDVDLSGWTLNVGFRLCF